MVAAAFGIASLKTFFRNNYSAFSLIGPNNFGAFGASLQPNCGKTYSLWRWIPHDETGKVLPPTTKLFLLEELYKGPRSNQDEQSPSSRGSPPAASRTSPYTWSEPTTPIASSYLHVATERSQTLGANKHSKQLRNLLSEAHAEPEPPAVLNTFTLYKHRPVRVFVGRRMTDRGGVNTNMIDNICLVLFKSSFLMLLLWGAVVHVVTKPAVKKKKPFMNHFISVTPNGHQLPSCRNKTASSVELFFFF